MKPKPGSNAHQAREHRLRASGCANCCQDHDAVDNLQSLRSDLLAQEARRASALPLHILVVACGATCREREREREREEEADRSTRLFVQ